VNKPICLYIYIGSRLLKHCALPSNRARSTSSQKMEAQAKAGARGARGGTKVAMVYYSKYVKTQNSPAVSIGIAQQLESTAAAVVGVAGGGGDADVDERASAFILAVRERFRNENKY
jgi:hypothetical protein